MLQCEVMERKDRNIARAKWGVLQEKEDHDKRFLNVGSDAKVPQTVQSMRIKYRASENPIKPVIQMNIGNARYFRRIAYHIAADPLVNYAHRTVGVSNYMFAISPMLGGNRQLQRAAANSGGRRHAEGEARYNRFGNHAERKLIRSDMGLKEIGVNRAICLSCRTAICARAAQIKHVSDPYGTYAVRARGLLRVGR